MIVQAVAGCKYYFIDIYTGRPDSVHNTLVFTNTFIY